MNKLALVLASGLMGVSSLSAAVSGQAAMQLLGDEVRVVIGGRCTEITAAGTRLTVTDGARKVVFDKNNEGAIKVSITKDGACEDRSFDSEDAMKKEDAALFELYVGKGKVYGESGKAEQDTSSGSDPDWRGNGDNIAAFRERVADIRRALENGAKGADGDLTDEEVKRLSREAKERLERDMKRLEERDRENARNKDPEEKVETGDGITQDRYLASLRALERSLLERISALRNDTNSDVLRALDDLAGKIKDTYAELRDKIFDEKKATWGKTLESGRKFFDEYSGQIDKWAAKVAEGAKAGNPYSDMRATERALVKRVRNMRKAAGDRFESILDDLEDKVKDTYAEMYDKLEEGGATSWKAVGEMHEKFSAQITADLDKLERQIAGGKVDRPDDRPPEKIDPDKPDWKDSESPERDVKLPPGEQADVIAGVRVARLAPLLRKQLNLDNGLSVTEIVNADGLLAEAGLEVYDIILEINGQKVDTRAALREAVKALKSGEELKLTVLRDGKKAECKCTKP